MTVKMSDAEFSIKMNLAQNLGYLDGEMNAVVTMQERGFLDEVDYELMALKYAELLFRMEQCGLYCGRGED